MYCISFKRFVALMIIFGVFFLRQAHIVGIKELVKQCDPNALGSKDIWPGDLSLFLPFAVFLTPYFSVAKELNVLCESN